MSKKTHKHNAQYHGEVIAIHRGKIKLPEDAKRIDKPGKQYTVGHSESGNDHVLVITPETEVYTRDNGNVITVSSTDLTLKCLAPDRHPDTVIAAGVNEFKVAKTVDPHTQRKQNVQD